MEVLLIPIEVVATFTPDGRVTPVRFRVILNEFGYDTITVNQITRRKRQRFGKTLIDLYTCSGTVQGMERNFELKYDIQSGEWSLYRM